METDYSKLRATCLCEVLQSAHPDWPFPLLFQGQEITRDLFFLDPVVEYNVVNLGKNPVRDLSFLGYPDLNSWFHYRFFNGIAPVVNSSESFALLPRLYRLKSALLDSIVDSKLAQYLHREFAMEETDELIKTQVTAVSNLIEICSHQNLTVWGMRVDSASLKEQTDYIQKIGDIRADVIFELPHFHRFANECKAVLAEEVKRYHQSEARFNKFIKQLRRLPSK